MSTLVKVGVGVVVGTFAVCGTAAIVSYCRINKAINQIAADSDRIMKETFGVVNDEEEK